MDMKGKTACAAMATGTKLSYIKPQTEIVELEPAQTVNTLADPNYINDRSANGLVVSYYYCDQSTHKSYWGRYENGKWTSGTGTC